MSDLQLSPKVQKIQTVAKYAGTGVVAVAASAAVIVAGTSLIAAATVGVVGLFMVNFVVPVAARSIALYKQKAITALTEKLSEETIREDELKEAERIQLLEQKYIETKSELEGSQEELRLLIKETTDPDNLQALKDQIQAMERVIKDAEEVLINRKADFEELQKANRFYISIHRSAAAMTKARGAEELQRAEIARNAIKTCMRAAMAGQVIERMNMNRQKPQSYDLLKTKEG